MKLPAVFLPVAVLAIFSAASAIFTWHARRQRARATFHKRFRFADALSDGQDVLDRYIADDVGSDDPYPARLTQLVQYARNHFGNGRHGSTLAHLDRESTQLSAQGVRP